MLCFTLIAIMAAFTSSYFAIVLHATWLVCASSQDAIVLPLLAEKKFHCITPDRTYSYTWKVNETVVTSNSTFPNVVVITSPRHTSNGSTQGSLIFMAHSQANNTNIKCFLTNRTYIITPLDYNIIIQGYLSPPDVVYVMEHHSVRFSWSAPFSLNITDYEPDILYYVIGIFTSTPDVKTTMNTTDTVYLLQPDLCIFSEYRVEIAAVNIVGMGERYISPPLSLEVLRFSSVSITFNKMFPVINIQISTTCPEDIHYNVELIPTFSTKRIVISNSSSVWQTSLTLSSPDIQLNEHYEAIVRVEGSTFLEYLYLSTFDVQNVSITHQKDLDESAILITCHFALGSHIKDCIIIISKNIDESGYKQCQYTAIREEGSTQGSISVRLPKGEYMVLVYDDEDVEVQNPVYNSTVTVVVSNSSLMLTTECESTMKINISTTNESSFISDINTVTIAVIILVAVVAVVIFLLLLLMAILIYKHLNCCREPSNPLARNKNKKSTDTSQDVVYASIADVTQSAAAVTSSPLTHRVYAGQKSSHQSGIDNPAYSMCLPGIQLPARNESEYVINNNPIYVMRRQLFMKPHGSNTSPEHHYDCVAVGNV